MGEKTIFAVLLIIGLTGICAAKAIETADACQSKTTKPDFTDQLFKPNETLEYKDDRRNMFKGYIQRKVDGVMNYVVLPFEHTWDIDHGESYVNLTEPHLFDYVLVTKCGLVGLQVTKLRPSGDLIYTFEQMQFTFGSDEDTCILRPAAVSEPGTHTYDCFEMPEDKEPMITLVIHRMDLDKYLDTHLPKKYNITWQ